MPSTHVSPGIVARLRGRPQIQAERTEGDADIVEHYVKEPGGSTAWRCGRICCRSGRRVRHAG